MIVLANMCLIQIRLLLWHKGNVDGMLLYAKTQEEITPDGQKKHKDGNTIYFRTLDLNSDFETIKKRLDSFLLT